MQGVLEVPGRPILSVAGELVAWLMAVRVVLVLPVIMDVATGEVVVVDKVQAQAVLAVLVAHQAVGQVEAAQAQQVGQGVLEELGR
jgi:hypothetical protein